MKKISESEALAPYERIFARARKKLDIRTPFSLKSGDRWYFDVPNDRGAYTLTCPPFSKDTEPSFLHYLCHAHILDAGWMLPITETKNIKEKAFFYTVNRSIDHFFDYYAWLLVLEVFGAKPLLQFSQYVAVATPEQVIRGLEVLRRQFQSPYPAYVTTLDWFSLFPTIASFADSAREERLSELFDALRNKKGFIEAPITNGARKVVVVRLFFKHLLKQYPRYDSLLKTSFRFKARYRAYYKLVWSNTGLHSIIKGFY